MFAPNADSIWGGPALDAPLEREAWSGRDLTYNCGQLTSPWPLYNYSDGQQQSPPPYDLRQSPEADWSRPQDLTLLGPRHSDSHEPTGAEPRQRPATAQSWLEEGLSQQKEYDLAQSLLPQSSPSQQPHRPPPPLQDPEEEQLILSQLGSALLHSLQHPPSPVGQQPLEQLQHQHQQQYHYQQQHQQQQHLQQPLQQQLQQQTPPMMPGQDPNAPAGDRGVPTHVLRRMWAQRNMHEDDNVTDMPIEERTTVMLRNLPNNYTRDMLLGMINREGFSGQYDFVYLPIDFRTHSSLGYAFINLVQPSLVPRFWNAFDGYNKWVLPSRKQCFVSWCGPYQGFQAHVERYRRSPVMHPVVPDEFKPAIFKDGQRIAFPQPTRKPRMPRLRNHPNSGA